MVSGTLDQAMVLLVFFGLGTTQSGDPKTKRQPRTRRFVSSQNEGTTEDGCFRTKIISLGSAEMSIQRPQPHGITAQRESGMVYVGTIRTEGH